MARAPPILPQDLIMEILSWLPVKFLMCLTCVSKSWKSLIFDTAFMKLHLQRSPKNTHILLTLEDIDYDYEEPDSYAIPYSMRQFLEDPSSTIKEEGGYDLKTNYCVCGSINGLVCLRSCYSEDEIKSYWIRFWNPAMRLRSKKSPRLLVRAPRSRPLLNFGFGYDDSGDTYKNMEGRIHSMGDHCWRSIHNCQTFPNLLEQTDGQFMSGSVNWLALDKLSCHSYKWESVTIKQLVIFSLDLRNETYRYLLLPEGVGEVPYVEPKLAILRGCMCLFHDHKKTHFVVWQMREFGVADSWTQLVRVSYDHLQCANDPFNPLLLMCLSENGDVLLLANYEELEVIMYNRRDNSVEHIQLDNYKTLQNTNDYVESLVLPHPN